MLRHHRQETCMYCNAAQRAGILLLAVLVFALVSSSATIIAAAEITNVQPSVCIFQPITSRIGNGSQHAQTLVHNATHPVPLLPFMQSLEPTLESDRFEYRLYLGFDFGDPLWDSTKTRTEFESVVSHMPIRIRWIRLYGSGNQITLAHNTITKTVYAEGCEYIVFSNDDLVFHTRNWTSKGVEQLLNYDVPNFGMVGFRDRREPMHMYPTFHMTHRNHMTVFDEFSPVYCPIVHRYACCDPFMFDVYAPFGLAVLRSDIVVENLANGNSKSRYHFDGAPPNLAVYARGRMRVAQVLKEMGKLQSWMPSDERTIAAYPVFMWRHAWLVSDTLLRKSPQTYFPMMTLPQEEEK